MPSVQVNLVLSYFFQFSGEHFLVMWNRVINHGEGLENSDKAK